MNSFGRCVSVSFETSDTLYLIFILYLPCLSNVGEEHETN